MSRVTIARGRRGSHARRLSALKGFEVPLLFDGVRFWALMLVVSRPLRGSRCLFYSTVRGLLIGKEKSFGF